MKKRALYLAGFLMFFTLCAMVLKPVPILPEDELTVVEGQVESIFEGGEFDVVFKLYDSPERYYINRGLEQGLTLEGLRSKLLDRKVTIKYPEFWSLLANGSPHHLSKLEHNGETIFSELKD